MSDAVTIVSDLLDHIMHHRVEEAIALFADDFILHTSGSYSDALTIRGKANVIRISAPFFALYPLEARKREEPSEQVFTHMFGHDDWVAVRLEVTDQSNRDKEPVIPVFAHPANYEWARGVEYDAPRRKMQAMLHVIDEKIDEVWIMVHAPEQRKKIIDAVNWVNVEKERRRKKGKNKRT